MAVAPAYADYALSEAIHPGHKRSEASKDTRRAESRAPGDWLFDIRSDVEACPNPPLASITDLSYNFARHLNRDLRGTRSSLWAPTGADPPLLPLRRVEDAVHVRRHLPLHHSTGCNPWPYELENLCGDHPTGLRHIGVDIDLTILGAVIFDQVPEHVLH